MRRRGQPDLVALSARLGYEFTRLDLLDEALTHPSASTPARPANQRLEFLGDRVLGLVVAEALMERFPDEAEGRLAPRLNALVRKETCADVARSLDLGEHLRLAKSELMSGGRRKTALLGDGMEAVIAAVYLDGGLDVARDMVLTLWRPYLEALDRGAAPLNAKTSLQEWAQARGLNPPDYIVTGRSGPDHAPVFTIEARLADGRIARGQAASKRAAQQETAAALLAALDPTT